VNSLKSRDFSNRLNFSATAKEVVMYICICAAVTDTTIRKSMADGDKNFKALCKELHVAQECGKCGSCARALFQEIRAEQQKRGTKADAL
jgi:bacterioferritin-associated ferredoxin